MNARKQTQRSELAETALMAESTSRILKANAARDLPARSTFNFEDLKQQAAAQLAQAREEANRIVDEARREAAAIKQKLTEEARAEGLKTGMQQADRKIEEQVAARVQKELAEHVQTTIPALAQVTTALQDEREKWLLHWEHVAVKLAVAIAEKLLHTQLRTQPELAEGMIAEALKLAAGQPQVQVRFNPQDLTRLGSHAGELVKTLTTCATPDLIPDASIAPGGCTIDSGHGEIDARLETMLERIASELLAL